MEWTPQPKHNKKETEQRNIRTYKEVFTNSMQIFIKVFHRKKKLKFIETRERKKYLQKLERKKIFDNFLVVLFCKIQIKQLI